MQLSQFSLARMWTRPKRIMRPEFFRDIRLIAHPDYLRDHEFLRLYFANCDPRLLSEIRVTETGTFDRSSQGRRTFYRNEHGLGYEFVANYWLDGVVRVDLNRGEVYKMAGNTYRAHGILQREAEWLKRLQGSGIVPELISSSATSIVTGYVGEPASPYNLPFNRREQAEGLLRVLAEHDCRHNDITAGNILVSDGRLRLIDFAWALPTSAAIPADWPIELGRHRLGLHELDDRHAIFKALEAKEVEARTLAQGAMTATPPAPVAPPRR